MEIVMKTTKTSSKKAPKLTLAQQLKTAKAVYKSAVKALHAGDKEWAKREDALADKQEQEIAAMNKRHEKESRELEKAVDHAMHPLDLAAEKAEQRLADMAMANGVCPRCQLGGMPKTAKMKVVTKGNKVKTKKTSRKLPRERE